MDRVIEAMAHLRQNETKNIRLSILGDGPERAALEAQTQALDLQEQIHFLGHVKDPYPYYAQADLLVMGSRKESFGLVIAEAGQYRTPTVAPNVGGIPEVIEHGQHGLLVEGTPQSIAKACSALIDAPTLDEQWDKPPTNAIWTNSNSAGLATLLSRFIPNCSLQIRLPQLGLSGGRRCRS